MTESAYAAEQLRVIRSLMERATLYRALSAPTALAGALLSFGGFGFAYLYDRASRPLTSGDFRALWLVILVLTSLVNLFVLWRGSVQRQEPFFSAGMRCALGSLAPAFITAGVVTLLTRHPMQLTLAWITLYGLALLATRTIAPRSLVLLGGTFLATGCVLLSSWKQLFAFAGHAEPTALIVSGVMAATFGGFHLVYAAAVWALQEDRVDTHEPAAGAGHV